MDNDQDHQGEQVTNEPFPEELTELEASIARWMGLWWVVGAANPGGF